MLTTTAGAEGGVVIYTGNPDGDMQKILDAVKAEFGSLWQANDRGPTLEIITPFTAGSSGFASVFITHRGEDFIVTDGGWLLSGEYLDIDEGAKTTQITVLEFQKRFSLSRHAPPEGTTFFYRRLRDLDLLPSAVADVASFLSSSLAAIEAQGFAERGTQSQGR